jgi:hypothetical protein
MSISVETVTLLAGPRERLERVLVAQHGKGHGVAVGEAHDDARSGPPPFDAKIAVTTRKSPSTGM